MSLFAIADTHLSLSADKPGYIQQLERLCAAPRKKLAGCCLGRRHGSYPRRCVVGDVARAALRKILLFSTRSPAKILMKGNHDYWWNTARKMENFFKEKGFETLSIVHNSAVSVGNISVCGTRGWFFDAEEDADKKVLLREAGRLPHIDKRNRARRRSRSCFSTIRR